MSKEIGIVVILAICVIVLGIGIMKQKAEILLNFVVRIVVGAAAIYFTNEMFAVQGSGISVGMNPASLLTIGVLGAGGYGLLYGILIYRSL